MLVPLGWRGGESVCIISRSFCAIFHMSAGLSSTPDALFWRICSRTWMISNHSIISLHYELSWPGWYFHLYAFPGASSASEASSKKCFVHCASSTCSWKPHVGSIYHTSIVFSLVTYVLWMVVSSLNGRDFDFIWWPEHLVRDKPTMRTSCPASCGFPLFGSAAVFLSVVFWRSMVSKALSSYRKCVLYCCRVQPSVHSRLARRTLCAIEIVLTSSSIRWDHISLFSVNGLAIFYPLVSSLRLHH